MDISQREGNYPPPPGASSILGVEFSGNVAELGPDTSAYSIGDEVLGLVGGVRPCTPVGLISVCVNEMFDFQGAYAEYIACSEKLLISKPSHLTWTEAASIPENFLTGALHVVTFYQKSLSNILV